MKNISAAALMKSSEVKKLIEKSITESVAKTFSHLISEDEKQKQDKVSKKLDNLGLRASDNKKAQDEDEETPVLDPDSSPKESEKDGVKKLPKPLEPSDAVKVLNIIRSGESLKDESVMDRFSTWWNTLSSDEKISLKAFLDGIAEVISGDSDPETASAPSRPPYNVRTSKIEDAPKEKITPAKTNLSQPSGSESSPIVVGEVNNTLREKSKMVD